MCVKKIAFMLVFVFIRFITAQAQTEDDLRNFMEGMLNALQDTTRANTPLTKIGQDSLNTLQTQQENFVGFLLKDIMNMIYDTTGISQLTGINNPLNDIEVESYRAYMEEDLAELMGRGPKGLDTLGEKAFKNGDYQYAIDYFEEYAAARKKANDSKHYLYAIRRLGAAHAYISNYKMAVFYGLQALQLDEDTKDTLGMAADNITLGMVHLNTNEYDLARGEFIRALALCRGRDIALERNAVFFLGHLDLNTKDNEQALHNLRQARQLDSIAKNYNNLIDDYTMMGFAYFTGAHPDSLRAVRCLTEAMKNVRANVMKANSINAVVKLASLQRLLGKYDDAMQMLSFVTGNYVSVKDQDFVKAKGLLAQLYADKKQYEKAYSTYKEYQQLSDSLFNENKNREVKKLEVEYQTAKKERALAKSEKERKEKELALALKSGELLKARLEKSEQDKKLAQSDNVIKQNKLDIINKDKLRIAAELLRATREKQLIYVGVVSILIISLLGVIYYLHRKDSKLKIIKEGLKTAKAKMARHVTFNTLQSIREVVQEKPDSADDYIMRFSNFIRGILENSDKEETSLAAEVSELENYMEFERMRSNESFDYQLQISSDIDPEKLKVPSLILQPIVENSILHGFKKLGYKGQLDISIWRGEGVLTCRVRDNGKGRQRDKTTRQPGRTSIGTIVTRERLQQYNRIANKHAFFEIKDLTPGVEVTLTLPEIYNTIEKN